MTEQQPDTTHFGYETVTTADKADRVRAVFDSVASRYDLMNDLMSGGLHRLWKRFTLARTGLRPGGQALDVAGGTGDLAAGLSRLVGPTGRVVLSDINAEMLAEGRRRLLDKGIVGNLRLIQANAEKLPFADASFDCITIGFGLRNVTDKQAALNEMSRLLKPGGRLLVLEFSKPVRYIFCANLLMRSFVASSSNKVLQHSETLIWHKKLGIIGLCARYCTTTFT